MKAGSKHVSIFQGKVALLGCNDCFLSVTDDNEVLCENKTVGEKEIIKVPTASIDLNSAKTVLDLQTCNEQLRKPAIC